MDRDRLYQIILSTDEYCTTITLPDSQVELLGPVGNQEDDKMNLSAVASVHGQPQGGFFKPFTLLLLQAQGSLTVAGIHHSTISSHVKGTIGVEQLRHPGFADYKHRDALLDFHY